MILRISFKDGTTFKSKIETASLIGNYCFSRNLFYIETEIKPESILSDFDTINSADIIHSVDKFDSDLVKQWCISKLGEEATKSFENSDNGQEKMKYVMAYLDAVEKSLKEREVRADAEDKENSNNKISDGTKFNSNTDEGKKSDSQGS